MRRLLCIIALIALGACRDGSGSDPRVPETVRIDAGDGQQGAVGATLTLPLRVTVLDQDGDPLPGQTVQFRVLTGGGGMQSGLVTTAADGGATDRWSLGVAAGAQTAEARVIDVATGATLAAATFTATAVAEAPAVVSPVGGASRTGPAGSVLLDSIAVRVVDRFGNPVAGAPISWVVASGGGVVAGAPATGAQGIARASWTLGPELGPQVVRAFAGVSLAAEFTAIATLPLGSTIAVLSGSGQTAPVGTTLADSLVVRVSLADGRPAAGVDVIWVAGSPGDQLSPAGSRTGSDGRAATRWTLGTGAGVHTARAVAAGGLEGAFVAVAQAGAPATMTAISGSGQSGVRGQPLPAPLVVELRDAFGNLVSGAAVSWTVVAGDGSVAPATSTTGAQGRATTTWTLGAVGGPGTVRASAAGVAPVDFTTPGSPQPASVTVFSGNGQSAAAGSALPNAVSARVRDAAGNPVAGVVVTWQVTSGSGRVDAVSSITDGSGLTQASWELGPNLTDPQRLSASVASLAPAQFTATATLPTVAVVRVAGDGQANSAGLALADSLVARVVLADGRAVKGISVSWVNYSPNGVLSPAVATSDAQGLVRSRYTLGPVVGPQAVRATALGAYTQFTENAIRVVYFISDSTHTFAALAPLPDSTVVQARDAQGNPIAGLQIRFTYHGGVASPDVVTTDAQGYARTQYTMGNPTQNVFLVEALAPAFRNTGVVFTYRTVTPLINVFSGNGQSGTVGQPLADSLRVLVRVPDGRPVRGLRVSYSGPGVRSPGIATTDANGVASTRWTLGATAGTQTVTARLADFTSAVIQVTFTATASP